MNERPIDIDAVMAEVRERVRKGRERGASAPEVGAAFALPLRGGGPLSRGEPPAPIPAPPGPLGEEAASAPPSRKPLVGPLITFARRTVIGLLRWWTAALSERQERINQLAARAIADLRDRRTPGLAARLQRLERDLARWREDYSAATLHSVYFQARFGGDEPVVRRQSEQFVDLFKGRRRVVDLGSGRGTFLELMREHGIGAYGVDLDPRMVAESAQRGLEVTEGDALDHLRAQPDRSLDGLHARHVAEHVLPGELVSLLREARRALKPGSPIVFVTPNPATLTVGGSSFWLDPSHVRPIPPELFRFYLEVEGFVDVAIRTFEPSERRLNENVPAGPIRENVKLLNETLFGDRDYAVTGCSPS